MKKIRFKDKCDICNSFGFCTGVNGYLVCDECLLKPLPEHTEHRKEIIKEFKFTKKGQMGLNI